MLTQHEEVPDRTTEFAQAIFYKTLIVVVVSLVVTLSIHKYSTKPSTSFGIFGDSVEQPTPVPPTQLTPKSTPFPVRVGKNGRKYFLVYQGGSSYTDEEDIEGNFCKTPWRYTSKQEEADVLIYNSLDSSHILANPASIKALPHQYLVGETMESISNYPMVNTFTNYSHFTMDYRLTSDFPIPYSLDIYDFKKPPVPFKEKTGLAAAFISNCGAVNGRTQFVKELMKHMEVDSYGGCMNNKKVAAQTGNKILTKMEVIKNYKFTFAFENSDDDDYVTEKLFQPLQVGSVPVFYGMDHIEDFSPTHGVIDAKKFESPKELAEFLNRLANNETEYNTYLKWKDGNWGDAFQRIQWIRRKPHYGVCALVERLTNKWINPYLTVWKRKSHHPDACIACLNGYTGPIENPNPFEPYTYFDDLEKLQKRKRNR